MPLSKSTMSIIGSNVRRERMLRNMSIEELSEILQLSTAFIGLIERGHRGAKLYNLLRIADIFGITVNDLVYSKSTDVLEVREGNENNEDALKQQKKDAIVSLVYDFSAEELQFLVSTIKAMRALKRSENKDEEGFDIDDDDDDNEPVNY